MKVVFDESGFDELVLYHCTASRKWRTRSTTKSGHKVPPHGGNGKQTGGSPIIRIPHKDGVTTD